MQEIDPQAYFGVELGPEDDHEEQEEKEKEETKAEPSAGASTEHCTVQCAMFVCAVAEELALLEEHRKSITSSRNAKSRNRCDGWVVTLLRRLDFCWMGVQELKKKEMEDLDGQLASLGIDVNENAKNADSPSKKKNRKYREKGRTTGTEEMITQTSLRRV